LGNVLVAEDGHTGREENVKEERICMYSSLSRVGRQIDNKEK